MFTFSYLNLRSIIIEFTIKFLMRKDQL